MQQITFASYRVPIYTPGWRAAMWIKCLAEGQKVPGIDGNRTRNPLIQSQGFTPIYHDFLFALPSSYFSSSYPPYHQVFLFFFFFFFIYFIFFCFSSISSLPSPPSSFISSSSSFCFFLFLLLLLFFFFRHVCFIYLLIVIHNVCFLHFDTHVCNSPPEVWSDGGPVAEEDVCPVFNVQSNVSL